MGAPSAECVYHCARCNRETVDITGLDSVAPEALGSSHRIVIYPCTATEAPNQAIRLVPRLLLLPPGGEAAMMVVDTAMRKNCKLISPISGDAAPLGHRWIDELAA